MRSSIACIRCRRSKVKCVNTGIGTTCRSCENSGRECAYPAPVTGAGGRRRDSTSNRPDVYGGADAERRQRPRKIHNAFAGTASSGLRESPRPLLDALDARLLTAQVWQELFDIFQLHYSADLPFLHPPSFLKPLRNASMLPQSNRAIPEESTARPPASTDFLLAFLALTARFHPKVVAHHSPPASSRPSNPLIASEYYAAAANERMATIWTEHRSHDIERIQALLMLGLHEWGMCRGSKAWLTVGIAIRAAQAMGLQYDLDLDDEPWSRSLALDGEVVNTGIDPLRRPSDSNKPAEDIFIQQEIRRRTFWSCYIMDRYLSSGKYRPQMLHADDLRIQLPASEKSFLFADKVRTLLLGADDGRARVLNQRHQSVLLGTTGTPEPGAAPSPRGIPSQHSDDEERGKLETGTDEGLISRYIKILEIYGKIIKWSCSGGRRAEIHPPWDSRSEFSQLCQLCQDFRSNLPRQHTLTPQNIQAHISMKTSTPYTLLHTVYLLCQIVLHREYVPFVPIRCSKPEGPLDAPTFPADTVPAGFWEQSARECFRSAREIMDLVRTCQEWGALVETPIVGFAVYTVAFNGVYCSSFPWMDPDGNMCTRLDPTGKHSFEKPRESKGLEAARKALEMVGMMRSKLHMAHGWFKTINRMHKYFSRMKRDYKKNIHTTESSSESDSPHSTRHLSLREGGPGGGLDDFRVLERTLQDFGNLFEDQDVEMTDASRPDSRPLDAVYDDSNSGATVKSEDASEKPSRVTSAPDPQKQESGSWSAINTAQGASSSRQPSTSTPNSAQFRSYESYPPSTSQPPPQHLPPPHGYTQGIGTFRPASFSEPGGSVGAPPSLTSPAAHSAATSTPSQSQPSPPYDRAQSYGGWHPQGSSTYSMPAPPPPLPNPYANVNGVGHSYQQNNHQPLHPPQNSAHLTPTNPSYPTPIQSSHPQQQQQIQSAPPMQGMAHQPPNWNTTTKEEWYMSWETRMGGDDVAAFTDGKELGEWANNLPVDQGYPDGWLSTVWGVQPL